MKTSKLLITSLLAAAAMSVPAWANDVSGDVAVSANNSTVYAMTGDTTFTFTNNPTLTGSISGAHTLTTSGNATLATGFGGTGDTRWTAGNLVVGSGTLQWGQGKTSPAAANQMKALGETISVSSGAALKIHLWTDTKLTTSTDDKVAVTSKIILNGTSTLETLDGSYYFSGGIQVGDGTNAGTGTFTANWAKGHVIGSLSGAGTFTINEQASADCDTAIFSIAGDGGFSGTVNFNYESGNNSAGAELHLLTENALKNATVNLTSAVSGKTATLSLDAATVNIKGLTGTSAGRVVAATAGNTLAIATETGATNTFLGTVGTSSSAVGLSVSGSGTQAFTGTSYFSTVSVGNGATLDLSGGNITLASAIANSGTVTVSDTTVFNFTESLKDGDVYTLISAGGTINGWDSLTNLNFTYNGAAITVGRGLTPSAAGVVSYNESATAKALTWTGAGSSVWKAVTITETPTAKPWQDSSGKDEAFYNGDSVTFANAGAQVSVEGTVAPAALTVSVATTFTGTGMVNVAAANLTTDAALTLEDNVVLDLGSISEATSKTISGTGTVKVVNSTSGYNAPLTLGGDFTGTIEYSGKFNTNNGANNTDAKFVLSDGSMWGTQTIHNDIHFQTNYRLGDSSATTIVLDGNLTQEAGTTLTIGTNANITFGGSATLGTLAVSGGTLILRGMSTSFTSADVSSGTLKFDIGAGNEMVQSGAIRGENSNASNLVIESGKLTLTRNDNNFRGVVQINNGGILQLNSGAALQTDYSNANRITIKSGGELRMDNFAYEQLGGSPDYAVHRQIDGGRLSITGATSASGQSFTVTANGGEFLMEQSGQTLTLNGNANSEIIALGGALKLGGAGDIVINKYGTRAAIVGSGSLEKVGEGKLTINSAGNTYTGETIVSKGTLVAGSETALGAAANAVRISGGQLEVGSGVRLAQTNIEIVLSDAYSSKAAITGDGALAAGTTITIAIADDQAAAIAAESALGNDSWTFQIATADSTIATSLAKENFVLAEALQGTWQISYTNGVLTLTIPEPSVFGLLAGLGALALAGTRRRRRKA